MEGLIEGRIVHYVMPDGMHCPAIIVRNWNEIAGTSNVTVFPDWANDAGYTEIDKQNGHDNRDSFTSSPVMCGGIFLSSL